MRDVVLVLFSGTNVTTACTPEYTMLPSLEKVTTRDCPLPVTGPGTVVTPLVYNTRWAAVVAPSKTLT